MDDGRRSLELRDGDALVAEAAPTDSTSSSRKPTAFDDAAVALPEGDKDSVFPEASCAAGLATTGWGSTQARSKVSDVVAATWTPRPDHVAPEFVWAALDCPGAYAVHGGERGMPVLGRLAAKVSTCRMPESRAS